MSAIDVDSLSDQELRTQLTQFGFPVMPITGTTRKLMVKKLKILLENQAASKAQDRRSLGKYSSEEDSDAEVKAAARKARRTTMAAPTQPVRMSLRKNVKKVDDEEVEDDDDEEEETVKVAAKGGDEVGKKVREVKEVTTTTRTTRLVKLAQDEYDTGSESESEIKKSFVDYKREPEKPLSPPSYSSRPDTTTRPSYSSPFAHSSVDTSFGTADRLNQIRSRLSLDRPTASTSSSSYYGGLQQRNNEPGNVDAPFLSHFTKRLSQISAANSPIASTSRDYNYKSDVIKENDTNGASSYSRTGIFRPSTASSPSLLLRGREPALSKDYWKRRQQGESNVLKSNMVSLAVLGVAILFFVVIGVMYLGIKNDASSVDVAGYSIPYCGTDPTAKRGVNCLQDGDVISAINVLKVVKPELIKLSVGYLCSIGNVRKGYMNESEIVRFISENYAMQDVTEIEKDLTHLQLLIFKNPSWGLSVVKTSDDQPMVTEQDVVFNMDQVLLGKQTKTLGLAVLNPDLPWGCSIYRKLSIMLNVTLFATAIFAVLYLTNYAYKYYKQQSRKRHDQVFQLVEKIMDMLQTSASDGDGYLVINHIRDDIIPINERKRMDSAWKQAVKFINENESRVRTELRDVQGETYEVWRWAAGTASPSSSPRPKAWQGQAFETQSGSVNSPPCSPTPCLKVRGMVEDGDRNLQTIREAVLSKCAHQCRILHCAVDMASRCVYLKCANQEEAAVAYRNLHGWWYAGHLVTVKYLRLKRYNERFPDSPNSGPPYLKALTPATDWSS